jgi:bacterial/archaeal transporter family-2 protein
MRNYFFLVAIAAVGGVAVALQSQFMGLMDKAMGTLESVFVTYASGGILIAIVMLVHGGGNPTVWRTVPWYALTAGVIGLIIVGSIAYTVPRLGLVLAFTILVASQFLMAAVLDHFGLLGAPVRPLDLSRILGVAVLLVGIWLIMR